MQGALFLKGVSEGRFDKRHHPGIEQGAPYAGYDACSSRVGGLGGTRSDASLAPSQAGNGCREFSVESSVSHHG